MSRKRISQDERMRRQVRDEIGAQFQNLSLMVKRCGALAEGEEGLDAIAKAALLVRANANLAMGFARVAKVETRHHTISENLAKMEAARGQLNSKNFRRPPYRGDELRERIEEKIQRIVRAKEDETAERNIEDMREEGYGADPYATFFTWTGAEEA